MNASQLWVYVDLSCYERCTSSYVHRQLEPSRNRSLNLKFHTYSDEEDSCPNTDFNYLTPRVIRSLDLRSRHESVKKMLEAIQLINECEFLAVSSHTGSGGTAQSVPTLPDRYLTDSPRLRTLIMKTIKFNHTLIQGLTNLTIDTRSPIQISEVLGVLECSPALEYLHLGGILPSTQQVAKSLSSLPIVTLNHLQKFKCYASNHATRVLWNQLSLPPTTQIHFVLIGGFDDAKHLKPFALLLREHFKRGDVPLMRSTSLTYLVNESLAVAADQAETFPEAFPFDPISHFSIIVSPRTQKAVHQAAAKILHALCLQSVSLHLVHNLVGSGFTPETWHSLLLNLPMVHTLKIEGHEGMMDILDGIIEALENGRSGLLAGQRRDARPGRFPFESPVQLSKLILVVEEWCSSIPSAMEEQSLWYDTLTKFLTSYRDLDKPYKPAGVCFGEIDVVSRYAFTRVYQERERLCSLLGTLRVNGQIFDPAEYGRRIRKQAKTMVRHKRRYSPVKRRYPEARNFDIFAVFGFRETELSEDSDFTSEFDSDADEDTEDDDDDRDKDPQMMT
jgi:hypothetical protein